MMNMNLVVNRDLGTITLENTNSQTILKLKRDESIMLLIIRLLYHEKLKETSINTNVVATLTDLHSKYDMLCPEGGVGFPAALWARLSY